MILWAIFVAPFFLTGCVGNKVYNPTQDDYLRSLTSRDEMSSSIDLAIIEFDEFGTHWDRRQLEDTISLLTRRIEGKGNGLAVIIYAHGWQNNADASVEDGDLARFQAGLLNLQQHMRKNNPAGPDRVFGIYLGWRGATSRFPIHRELTFWDRKATAERIASYDMRETLFKITRAAKTNPRSKVMISGHSMGGMIIAKTLAPAINTLLLTSPDEGIRVMADLVILMNPALDSLTTLQFIDFLKRARTVAELRESDGTVKQAKGPVLVSLTSEADWVTRVAYPAGQIIGSLGDATRGALGGDLPNQRTLLTSAHGHNDYLVSHFATNTPEGLQIEAIPDAYNDTPFWIVRTSGEICRDHGDIYNPLFQELLERFVRMNDFYDSETQVWLRNQDSKISH